MPYRKSYRRRRYSRRPKKEPGTIAKVARTALSIAKFVRGIVNVEKHFFDTNQAITGALIGGTVYPLTQIVQGDAYNQREGNSIKAVSHQIRMVIQPAVTATSNNVARFIVFRDTQQQGTTPTVAQVLETGAFNSYINHLNGQRFQVIWDKVVDVPPQGQNDAVRIFKLYKKDNSHIKYSGPNFSDTREGNIYVLVISNELTDTPFIEFNYRLRYVDN